MSDILSMSSAYAGSVQYYAAMVHAGVVTINDIENNIAKKWAINHCRIVGANGVQTLTIPIVKNALTRETIAKDIKISAHGDWERVHWGAIFSAYGKAPFFEYIEYDLHRIYMNHSEWLLDFNEAIHSLVIDFLDLPIISSHTSLPSEKNSVCRPIEYNNLEYYQTWKDRHGFIPDLSIYDLLMNTGRESIFTLMEMAK